MRILSFILWVVMVAGVPVLVRAGDYPTNLLHLNLSRLSTGGTNVPGMVDHHSGMTAPAAIDVSTPLYLVEFTDIPIITLIDNLTRSAGINYQVDPRCKDALGRVPLITLRVKDVRPRALLNSILASNGFVLYEDPVTTVATVTSFNLPRRTIDENLAALGGNSLGGYLTNAWIPLINFNDVPIDLGLKNLARQDGTNILIDPGIDTDGTMLTFSWKRLTARQAILALCQNYDLKMTPVNNSGTVTIQDGSPQRPISITRLTNGFVSVDFQDVAMITAIENLTEQGEIDYLVDPHYRHRLLGGGAYYPGDQMVNIHLKGVSVDDAFTALLKPRGFVMLDEPVSGISMITSYSHRPYVLDGTLLHMETNIVSGTNGIFHPVEFFNEPVDSALNSLITASGLEIKLAGAATNEVNWAIYLHAKHSTAKQELYAICQACEFEIVRDDDGQVVIRPKTLKHYHHVYIH